MNNKNFYIMSQCKSMLTPLIGVLRIAHCEIIMQTESDGFVLGSYPTHNDCVIVLKNILYCIANEEQTFEMPNCENYVVSTKDETRDIPGFEGTMEALDSFGIKGEGE